MNELEDISLCTYTNEKYKDVLNVYLGQLQKHFPINNNFVFTNANEKNTETVRYLQYNNEDDYYVQYTECLKRVPTEYIIYAQEDFILYDNVDIEKLKQYKNFLQKNNNISFVRLIRTHSNIKKEILNLAENDLYHVEENENLFLMQATLWKKDDLMKLYLETKSQKWYEGKLWIDACKKLNISGVFSYNGEKLRGRAHCDSKVYPYMCTAINKGKWNMNEYGEKLKELFNIYNVNYKKRGLRLDYGVYI